MNKNEVFEIIKENILEILPDVEESDITLENSLKTLGANSIDRMDIIVDTMNAMKVKVPMVEFGKANCIGDIITIICEHA